MRIISHPFRLSPNGEVATVEQVSDIANAEQLGVLVATRLGERPLVPAFGIPDPVFGALELGDISAGVALFGPPVVVRSVTERERTETEVEVDVDFI